MRRRQTFTIIAMSLALGLTGAVSASANPAAPAGSPAAAHGLAPYPGKAAAAAAGDATAGAAAAAAAAAADACGFVPAVPADRFQGIPSFDPAAAARPYRATLVTSQGRITFQARTDKAPCTTFSFRFLTSRGYYDHTHCHRLTIQRIFVLLGALLVAGLVPSAGPARSEQSRLTVFAAASLTRAPVL